MSSIYRKGEVLGWGSVAVVYRGWDELLDRSVAIKELKQPYAGNEPFSRSFRAQALKMLDLSSRYVMATYALDGDRSVQAVVRELAEETVGQRSFHGPMEPEVVLRLLRQILAGLDTLHGRGLIHGAVKPENIFVCGGDYKIGDFGLPALEGAPPFPPSRYRYSSPEELLEPDRVDRCSDVYSLGVVAYELILGPLRLEQVVEELVRGEGRRAEPKSRPGERDELWRRFHGSGTDLPPIHELDPGVPAALSLTLQKMISKDHSVRFANCKKVLASLGTAAPMELPTGSQRISIAMNMPAPAAASPPNPPARPVTNWVWAGGGALTVSVLIAAGAWTFGTHDAGRTPASPTVVGSRESPAPQPSVQQPSDSEGDLADRLLRLRSSEGGLSISLEPPVGGDRPRLALGTSIHFRVASNRDGRLLLFALSSDGSLTCLYPNPQHPVVTIAGGASLVLPSAEDGFKLQAQAPLGRELVFAVISSRDLPPLPTASGRSVLSEYSAGDPAQAFVVWLENLRRENRKETRMAVLDLEISAAR
jgi:serine/threonine protein kinase